MDKIVDLIIKKLLDLQIVNEDDLEIYIFGIHQLLLYAINLMTILVVGLIFGHLLELIAFSITYVWLRIYAGGYHADTEVKCYIISTFICMSALFLGKIMHFNDNSLVILLVIATLVIIFNGPIETDNKQLDETEQKIYGKRMLIVLLTELLILYILIIFRLESLSTYLILGIISVAFMQLAGVEKNRTIVK